MMSNNKFQFRALTSRQFAAAAAGVSARQCMVISQ